MVFSECLAKFIHVKFFSQLTYYYALMSTICAHVIFLITYILYKKIGVMFVTLHTISYLMFIYHYICSTSLSFNACVPD